MLGLALAIATVKTQNVRVRRAAAAFVPVTLLIILLTQSRGVFLGLLVGFGPPLLARLRKRPSGTTPVLVVLAVIAVLVPAASWHRLEGITNLTETIAEAHKKGVPAASEDRFDQFAADSARHRFDILKTGLHIAASHPVLGVGIGGYSEANARYAPQLGERDAHNTYVSLAAEMGFPGLLLWLGLVGSVLAQVRRRRAHLEADDRTIQVLWIERAVIGFLVAGFFASYADLTMFYLFLGILWAASNMLGSDATEPAEATVPHDERCGLADMCGIAGFAGIGLPAEEATGRLRAMCDAIQHRGPDSDGYFVGEGRCHGHAAPEHHRRRRRKSADLQRGRNRHRRLQRRDLQSPSAAPGARGRRTPFRDAQRHGSARAPLRESRPGDGATPARDVRLLDLGLPPAASLSCP